VTEVAELEREPVMRPTIVRRVVPGALQKMERRVDGERALCVFWSLEHAERAMYEAGYTPDEGWKAIERDHEELALVFSLLAMTSGPKLAFVEPAPNDPDVGGVVVEPEDFIGLLEDSLRS
jgi:hypothetical protein